MRLTLATLVVVGLAAVLAEEEEEYKPSYPSDDDKSKEDELSFEERKEKASRSTYCEADNCYELLGVSPDSKPAAIKRAFRKFSAEWHPDKCPSGNIELCREKFPKYANAYDVLSTSENRKNYDFLLAHPHEFPGFFLKYTQYKYAPQSDMRIVFVLTLLCFAGFQHLVSKSMYEQAIDRMKKDPRSRYQERLKELMNTSSPSKSGSAKAGKSLKGEELETRKKEAEAQLAVEMAAELPPPPSFANNVAVSVFKLPLTTLKTATWALTGGMREPGYMTRRALGVSAAEWESYDEGEQAELVGRELWVAENMKQYEAEAKSDSRPKSGKEKREARQRKRDKANPSAMQLDD
jgi:DnaJ family protein C protein 25